MFKYLFAILLLLVLLPVPANAIEFGVQWGFRLEPGPLMIQRQAHRQQMQLQSRQMQHERQMMQQGRSYRAPSRVYTAPPPRVYIQSAPAFVPAPPAVEYRRQQAAPRVFIYTPSR